MTTYPPVCCAQNRRGLICNRKRNHGGKYHVAYGLQRKFLARWKIGQVFL